MEASILAEKSTNKQEKARLAQEGINHANNCVMKTPEEAACYYWRAINTGIYYEAHITGYQDGLKSMIKDCKTAIKLNDKIDHGGAYRTIGKIYTDVPEASLTKNGITRDFSRAISYLQKAVQVDPNYPENHIYLAQVLLETGEINLAKQAFTTASTILPQWKNHRDYALWQKANKQIANKLK